MKYGLVNIHSKNKRYCCRMQNFYLKLKLSKIR